MPANRDSSARIKRTQRRTPSNGVEKTPADKRAEADRRFQAARKRFLRTESNRKLLIELAKR